MGSKHVRGPRVGTKDRRREARTPSAGDPLLAEIEIGGPVEVAWATLVDFRAHARWDVPVVSREDRCAPALPRIERGRGSLEPGMAFVLELRPNAFLSVRERLARPLTERLSTRLGPATRWWRLEAVGPDRTRVVQARQFDSDRGAVLLAADRALLRGELSRSNAALRAEVESRLC